MAIINGRGTVGIRSNVSASPSIASPTIVLDGLKLHLDAGNVTSYPGTGTVWTDISGNGIIGTFNGPNGLPTYNSSNGGCIVFDGTDDRINLSSLTSYTNTQPHSYSMWVYPTAFATYKWLLNNGTTTAGTSLILNSSRIGFFYQGGTAFQAGTISLLTNSWYHLVAAYNGSGSVSFYINGALDVTRTFATTWGAANSNPSIGIWGAAGSNFFAGKISNVQVYNKALSDAEVLQNYDALKSRFYPQVSDSDAQSFIYAAGIQDSTQGNAVNTLVTSLKSAGVWTKMKAIYPFVGGTASSHKFNLKDPRDLNAAFRLTFTAGWVHSSTGALPNGTSDYANTFLNASIMTANSEHLSNYSRTATIKNRLEVGLISYTSNKLSYVMFQHSTSNRYVAIQGGDTMISTTPTTGAGFTISNRRDSAKVQRYLNNSKLELSSTGNGVGNLNYYLSSINGNSFFGSCEIAFGSIGDGLTDTEASNFYTAVQTYQTSLGRQV